MRGRMCGAKVDGFSRRVKTRILSGRGDTQEDTPKYHFGP